MKIETRFVCGICGTRYPERYDCLACEQKGHAQSHILRNKKMSTMIICQLKNCIHNRNDRCQCDAIGMEAFQLKDHSIIAKCDSYYVLPDIVPEDLVA